MPLIESLILGPGSELHLRVSQENPSVVECTVVTGGERLTVFLDRGNIQLLQAILTTAQEYLAVY